MVLAPFPSSLPDMISRHNGGRRVMNHPGHRL